MESRDRLRDILHRLKALPLYSREPEEAAFEAAPLRVLVTRLSKFRDVERSTSHRFLECEVLAAIPEAFVDFCFFPEAPDIKTLRKAGISPLHGIRSWREACDFDLVLVSCSFSLELPNLPWLLTNSGLGIWASTRLPRDPVILYGGSNAIASGALISWGGAAAGSMQAIGDANFPLDMIPDAMHFGEGEGVVGEAARAVLESGSKGAALKKIAGLDGFIVTGRPRASGPVRKRVVREVARIDGGSSGGHSLNGEEAGTVRLEISRGCPAFCSFCFESWDRKPYRELPIDLLLSRARALKASTGASTIELSSFNFNSHPDILPLILELNKLYRQVNFMSQRLDYLGGRSGLLEAELAAGKRSFTLGIEGISETARRRYNKAIPEHDLRAVIASLHEPRVREIKLFYVLSGEEDEAEVAEFAAFMAWLKGMRGGLGNAPRILVSANLLTRMPCTPEVRGRLRLDEREWQPLIEGARRATEGSGFEFRMASDFGEYAMGQALALAPFGRVALEALIARGAYYDEGMRGASWPDVEAALRSAGLLAEESLSGAISESGLPVDTGIASSFIARAEAATRSREAFGLCHGADCLGCAACADEEERAMARGIRNGPSPSDSLSVKALTQAIGAIVRDKDKARPMVIGFEVPERFAGANQQLLDAAILKALCSVLPDSIDLVLSARELLFSRFEPSFGPWWGLSRIGISTLDPERLCAVLAERLDALASAGFIVPREFGVEDPEGYVGEGRAFRYLAECRMAKRLYRDPACTLSRWLSEHHLPATMRKMGAGVAFELSPKALKKKILFSASIEDSGSVWLFRFEADSRFNPRDFLEVAGETGAWRLAPTRVIELKPS